MTFTCQRCGQCCMYSAKPDLWVTGGTNLTIRQKHMLLHNRLLQPNLKRKKRGCEMYADGGCLIQNHFGHDAKPDVCKKYPVNDYCYRMHKDRIEDMHGVKITPEIQA